MCIGDVCVCKSLKAAVAVVNVCISTSVCMNDVICIPSAEPAAAGDDALPFPFLLICSCDIARVLMKHS